MNNDSIDALMRPKSIAVVGASATPGKIGYTVVKNLQDSKFAGAIYPINLRDPEILGLQCYKSVLDVPGSIDAAVIAVPAKFVPAVAEECGKKGVKGLNINEPSRATPCASSDSDCGVWLFAVQQASPSPPASRLRTA